MERVFVDPKCDPMYPYKREAEGETWLQKRRMQCDSSDVATSQGMLEITRRDSPLEPPEATAL